MTLTLIHPINLNTDKTLHKTLKNELKTKELFISSISSVLSVNWWIPKFFIPILFIYIHKKPKIYCIGHKKVWYCKILLLFWWDLSITDLLSSVYLLGFKLSFFAVSLLKWIHPPNCSVWGTIFHKQMWCSWKGHS